MTSSAIVQKLWKYCNVFRDDLSACGHAQAGGMSYLLACTRRQARGQGLWAVDVFAVSQDGGWANEEAVQSREHRVRRSDLADVGEGCERGRECFTYRTKNSGLV